MIWTRAFGAIRLAVAFLTRIPVRAPSSSQSWPWAAGHFPLVGFMLGALLAGVWGLLGRLDPLARALACLGVSMLLTGALHEDGLADTADALGGDRSRERTFEILKDSRIGTFGAVALVISIGLRTTLLAGLGQRAPWALVLSQGLGRLPPVWLCSTLPYVTPAAVAHSRLVTQTRPVCVWVATGWGLLGGAVAVWCGLRAVMLLPVGAVLLLLATLLGLWFRRRLGGVTGDLLGCAEQLSEVAVLLVLAMT